MVVRQNPSSHGCFEHSAYVARLTMHHATVPLPERGHWQFKFGNLLCTCAGAFFPSGLASSSVESNEIRFGLDIFATVILPLIRSLANY